MPTQTQKIPNPIYAAAGAGDLAIERLRKLPERVAVIQERVTTLQDELPGRMNVIGDKVTQKVAELPSIVAELRQRVVDTDTDKLRATARRNAGTFVANAQAGAQAAQEKAVAIYTELVARGERVVSGTVPAVVEPVAEIVTSDVAAATAAVHEAAVKAEAEEAAEKPAPAKRATKPRKTS